MYRLALRGTDLYMVRRYMNESVIVESGTHEQLLKEDGGYANIWNLQAQAFL